MKKIVAILLALVMVLSFAACSGGGDKDNGGASGDVKEIAVLVPNADHGWTGAVLNYANEKAKELTDGGNYKVNVYAATDAKAMQEQIDDLLAASKLPAGIVILPYDNTMESSILNIQAAGVPYTMFDRIIDNDTLISNSVSCVKGDNEGIGAATAERFIELGLKPGDKVYVLIGDTSSVPEMRNNGFEAALKEAGWSDADLANLEYSQATNWSRSESKTIFVDWINSKTVDQLAEYQFIFTHDSEIIMGILEALAGTEIEQAKKDAFLESVVSIGASSGLNEVYQVLKGEHENTAYPDIVKNFDMFDVTYDPAMIQTAIQDMVDYLEGGTVSQDHVIPVDVVDADNVSEYQGF